MIIKTAVSDFDLNIYTGNFLSSSIREKLYLSLLALVSRFKLVLRCYPCRCVGGTPGVLLLDALAEENLSVLGLFYLPGGYMQQLSVHLVDVSFELGKEFGEVSIDLAHLFVETLKL